MSRWDISQALDSSVRIAKAFAGVTALGMTGSHAMGVSDGQSDIDICIFVSEELPAPEQRRTEYSRQGIVDIEYFDVDFDVSRSDGLKIEGIDCGFIWMTLQRVKAFLQDLDRNFDCDEFLPGGLLAMKPLFDPENVIEQLRVLVPAYPETRAIHRIKGNIDKAYFSLYVLRWLDKAALRNDHFSFLKAKYEVLDNFLTALFALNRQWLADEKRLSQRIEVFRLCPEKVAERMESIIMHKHENADLASCVRSIKQLFQDLASISCREHQELDLPSDWQ